MKTGVTSIIILLIGTIFSLTIGGLVLFGVVQHQTTRRNQSFQHALSIAEAGINYYRWHLAHDPLDYADGTGNTGAVYTHTLPDPQGGTVGEFELRIIPPTPELPFVTVASTGSSVDHPDVKRTITARFGERSLASFAFLHNANVWFGQGITIYGEVFSNGGIRMDGTNTSTVKSAKETYTCGVETGCWPNIEEKPGIWGNGGPQELWEFPVLPINFDTITIDMTTMQQAAISSGKHLLASDNQGYHLVFNSDGSVSVYDVLTTDFRKGYSLDNDCENLYQVITNEQQIGTYQITDTPIFFIEDTVWVEGVVNGKVTVVAAKLPTDTNNENIWIKDNLTYTAKDGTSVLGLIAQNDIIMALDIPNTFEIDAALLAQKGRVIRHHYRKTNKPQCSVYNNATRGELIIYGAVISNQKSYWNFSGGPGSPSSGFVKRTITYDTNLLYQSPPYFPTAGEVDLVSWNETANP